MTTQRIHRQDNQLKASFDQDKGMLTDDSYFDGTDDIYMIPAISKTSVPNNRGHEFKMDYEDVTHDYGMFSRKHLSFVNFITSSFRFARFMKSTLVGANFSSSDAHGANFKDADLEFAELHHCDFSEADFTGANLQGCNIVNCDFSWANLRGANLEDCQIRDTDFSGATIDQYTKLPFSNRKAASLGLVVISQKADNAS